ncbi:hypothetical protein ACIRRA_01895 [Nocardia sp. NPDC101769]|uniref:hypothetical protein n=1 Tax=Nocardia sp. NPDC101769 TaxID=3364333 RepID=UPI0037FEAA67
METARRLAEHGARVVLACRNADKAAAAADTIRQTAPDAELPFVELDLTSLKSVHRAAGRLHDDFVFRIVMQTVEMGALPSLRAASDPGVRGGDFYGPTGSTKGYPVPNAAGERTRDPELAAPAAGRIRATHRSHLPVRPTRRHGAD